MKVYSETGIVERSGVGSEAAATIKATAKAFDILSSGLYTDRILAVVRELSCNAYDSHVAAGKCDVPFEIHMPNSLEPWFSVKDNGTGLSHEDVMTLYLTYFDSTKTSSNDFIGALGLGSKSPFAYTKAFEVISRFNGKRRIYSVFINEEGVPSRACLGEFDTDEGNGFEVKVTVMKGDFYTFPDKVRQALRWFPVKPKVIGVGKFEWDVTPKEALSGKNWKMFSSNYFNHYGYAKMTAVQGNVSYKVDVTKLDLDDADKKLIENCHIVGFFSIGELEVAASREEIRYDKRSSAALVACVKDVRAGILAGVEKHAKELEKGTFWQAVVVLNQMSHDMFDSFELFKSFVKESKHPILKRYIKSNGSLELPQIRGYSLTAYSMTNGSDPEKGQIKQYSIGRAVDPSVKHVVFHNDMKLGGVAKIKQYIRNNAADGAYKIAIVIRRNDSVIEYETNKDGSVLCDSNGQGIIKSKTWTDKQYQKEYTEIAEALGDVEILLASRDAPKTARGRVTSYNNLPVYRLKGCKVHRYGKETLQWDVVQPDKFDFNKGGLFFFIRNGAVITLVDSKGETQDVNWPLSKAPDFLKEAVRLVNDALGTSYSYNSDLYAFGSAAAKKCKKFQNWHNIFDILQTVMVNYKDGIEYFKKVESTSRIMGLSDVIVRRENGSSYTRQRNQLIAHLNKLSNKSEFKKTLMPLIDASEKFDGKYTVCSFLQKLDVDLGTKIFDNIKVTGYFGDKSFDSYPMLTFTSQFNYLDADKQRIFFDYISTIDRS